MNGGQCHFSKEVMLQIWNAVSIKRSNPLTNVTYMATCPMLSVGLMQEVRGESIASFAKPELIPSAASDNDLLGDTQRPPLRETSREKLDGIGLDRGGQTDFWEWGNRQRRGSQYSSH